jgi:hypothetical protein
MKRLILLSFLFALGSCVAPSQHGDLKPKEKPEHSIEITDPEIKVISDSYFDISKRFNLGFSRKVSIGFTKIPKDNVIGLCTFGKDFREIDLDADFWNRASWPSKVALLYHEMTHCYCTREHDFDGGTMYPDGSLRYILDRFTRNMPSPLKPEGYLDDGCPKSIMHPIIVDNYCFNKHYGYYIEEMFNRCDPWK